MPMQSPELHVVFRERPQASQACVLHWLRSVMHPEECVGSADKSFVSASDSFLNVHIVDTQ